MKHLENVALGLVQIAGGLALVLSLGFYHPLWVENTLEWKLRCTLKRWKQERKAEKEAHHVS